MFLTVCGIAAIGSEMYKARLKAKAKATLADDELSALDARLAKMEERLSNLETLAIDRDKHAEFDRALR